MWLPWSVKLSRGDIPTIEDSRNLHIFIWLTNTWKTNFKISPNNHLLMLLVFNIEGNKVGRNYIFFMFSIKVWKPG